MSFVEYYDARWTSEGKDRYFRKTLTQVVNVIAWNFWQMDGLKGTVPYCKQIEKEGVHQMDFFDLGWATGSGDVSSKAIAKECRIFDWRSKQSVLYSSLEKEGDNS